jgi:1,4-alpha-glucan branching enzyme
VLALVRDLNALHRERRPLHQLDHERAGFDWIDVADRSASVVSFIRYARDPADHVVVVVNFTPVVREGYRIGVPGGGQYVEILNTDQPRYGGSGVANRGPFRAEPVTWHGRAHSVSLTLPPLAAVMLAPSRG